MVDGYVGTETHPTYIVNFFLNNKFEDTVHGVISSRHKENIG
jgi:hypothetical protein